MTVHAYLDYAGLGRVRERARTAMRETLDEVLAHGSAAFVRVLEARESGRVAAARLLACDPREIAFVPNTSTGLQLVADGMEWRAGDEVVAFDRDFPANVQPWRRLEARGVRLRAVPMRDGGYDLADVEAQLGPATRLLAVSHVNFATGFRIDLDRVVAAGHAAGAVVCVDAVQSLGALPLSLARTPVDFLAAGGHKWLCGPPGSGLFFCRRERLDDLPHAPAGWFGYEGAQDVLVKGPGHFRYDLPLRDTARRFEGGMFDALALVGFAAALAELNEIGIDVVGAAVLRQAAALRTSIAAQGYKVVEFAAPEMHSGIVAFVHPQRGSEEIARHLAERGVFVSYPDGTLRASPHYWTNAAEIDRFLHSLASASP